MKIVSISAYRHTHYRKPREPGEGIGPREKAETEEERVERIWQNILSEIHRMREAGEA